jgi:hypothetical protein
VKPTMSVKRTVTCRRSASMRPPHSLVDAAKPLATAGFPYQALCLAAGDLQAEPQTAWTVLSPTAYSMTRFSTLRRGSASVTSEYHASCGDARSDVNRVEARILMMRHFARLQSRLLAKAWTGRITAARRE